MARDQLAIATSTTPFILDRHPHRKTVDGEAVYSDSPEDQIRRSLRYHRLPDPLKIEIFMTPLPHRRGSRTRLDTFRRTRKNDPHFPVVGARLTFDEPQSGPMVLGRYAHFGLGQFRPKAEAVVPLLDASI